MAYDKEVIVKAKSEGIDETLKKVKKLSDETEGLKDKNKELSKTMDSTKQSVLDNGGAMGLLNDATGGLAMTVKDAVEASALFAKESKVGMTVQKAYTAVMGSSTGALKIFKLALIGTGIGAIVIGIGLLIANFDKVKTAVMNFIPGLKSVGEFFGNIVDAVTDFIGVTSEAERAMADLTEQADKSLAMNKKFMAEQGYFQDEFTKKKIDAKNRYLEAVKEEGASQVSLARQLNAELADIDKQRIDDQNKRREDEATKANEEYKKSLEDAENKRKEEYDLAEERRLKRLELEKKLNDEDLKRREEGQKAIAEMDAEDDQREIDAENTRLDKVLENIQKEKIAEETLKNMKVSIRENTMNLIGALAKKGSAVSKAIQIAEIVREQVSSGSKSLSAMTVANAKAISASPLTGGQPFVSINTAQVLTGMALSAVGAGKAIKDIMSESKTPTSFSAGAGGAGGGSAPSAPSFNLVQGTGSNQIAEGLGQQQRPIQAYVVSNNVTTAQSLDRNIIAGASL